MTVVAGPLAAGVDVIATKAIARFFGRPRITRSPGASAPRASPIPARRPASWVSPFRNRNSGYAPQPAGAIVPSATIILYGCLVLLNLAFAAAWIRAAKSRQTRARPSPGDVAIGCGTNFLDTLGIGNYAQ